MFSSIHFNIFDIPNRFFDSKTSNWIQLLKTEDYIEYITNQNIKLYCKYEQYPSIEFLVYVPIEKFEGSPYYGMDLMIDQLCVEIANKLLDKVGENFFMKEKLNHLLQ